MQEITAAVAHAVQAPLQLERLHIRNVQAGEVQVRLEAVAICHSDISYLDGGWPMQMPAVFGHEAAGVIEAVGPGVKDLAAGMRVVVCLVRSCGTCASCGAGQQVFCDRPGVSENVLSGLDGTPVTQGLKCGAFAEKVVVDQSQVVEVPETMSADAACLLACGVPTGLGAAVNTAGVRPGDKVVVIGAGGVGLNAIQGARIAGASRIVAVDLAPGKLDDAKAFGATDAVLASDKSPWRAAKAALGAPGADHVFVTVGAPRAYDEAWRYLGKRGTAYAVGMPHSGDLSTYEPVMVAATGQAMRGSLMGEVVLKRDIPWMVDLYDQGRLQLDELISKRWRFDQINEAIADTKTGAARRNVIVF